VKALARFLPIFAMPQLIHAAGNAGEPLGNPVVMVIVLAALALAPFIIIMLTSFVKISVVLSILRNAMGTQQVPPTQIITGLSFILTIFIMTPVVKQMYEAAGGVVNTKDIFSEASIKSLYDASVKGKEPLRQFLGHHSHVKDRELFIDLAVRMEEARRARGAIVAAAAPQSNPAAPLQPNTSPADQAAQPAPLPPLLVGPPIEKPGKDDFQVLIPAFVTSQLKEAFEVGFLIFVPFIVVDMVVANILLAMGMSMLSPTVISLPFKLLLFVLVDGWFLIVRGLVLSYV
jgi:type III secretion protein R